MPSCDLCGKRVDFLSKAIVEGSTLNVCGGCSKFGRVIGVNKPIIKEEPKKNLILNKSSAQEEETIVQDYSDKIKKARESLNLTQEQLAKALAEKESFIHKLETGNVTPSIKTARKLEQFFRVKLIHKQKIQEQAKFNLKNTSLTIGDLLKMKENE